MCLVIEPHTIPEILETPKLVYKVCFCDKNTHRVFAGIRTDYEYKSGVLYICPNPFGIELFQRRYADFCEKTIISNYIEEHYEGYTLDDILTLANRDEIRFISTGFHFCYTLDRAKKTLSSMYYEEFELENLVISPFLIPKGAKVLTGIDNELGITNKIIRI